MPDAPPAPAYAAPIYNWTGFYIGGHVGGAFTDGTNLMGSDARFLGGVQGGFDYQFAPNWVMGIEAQYSWLPSSSNTPGRDAMASVESSSGPRRSPSGERRHARCWATASGTEERPGGKIAASSTRARVSRSITGEVAIPER